MHIKDEILPATQSSARYDLATLWFGANDAALPDRFKYETCLNNLVCFCIFTKIFRLSFQYIFSAT